MTDQRIKLAEFTGEIIKVQRSLPYPNGLGWMSPSGDVRPIPDPRNDANDCEALIRKLVDMGFTVFVTCAHDGDTVSAVTALETTLGKRGGDWKHGVCDLAEKVIDEN